MSDKWYNKWLQIRAVWMRFMRWDDLIKIPKGTAEHMDNFWRMDRVKLYENYLPKQPWGQYHPKKTIEWYDEDSIKFSPGKGIELWVDDDIHEPDPNVEPPIIIDRSVGLISSKFKLSYGLYEWNITLPQGSWLWPAVWLTHPDTWPPEIDILEAYTNAKGKYGDRVETNFHFGHTPHYGSSGAGKHGFGLDTKAPLNIKCLWTNQFVKVYYNNILVRRISEGELISQLNQNPWMQVIINNSIRQKDDINKQSVSPMVIQNFVYYTIK